MKIHRTNKLPTFKPIAIEIDTEQELEDLKTILTSAKQEFIEQLDDDDEAERMERVVNDYENRIKTTQK